MFIFDFLFYYLALYFTKRKQTLVWSTPESRTAYALGLTTTCWILALIFFILVYILKTKDFNGIYIYSLIPVSLSLIWLFGYIYTTKGRYKLLKTSDAAFLKISEISGIVTAWFILFFSFALPFIILISDMKQP
jgi:hypothetical protein